MIHPTTWHTEGWRAHVHHEHLHTAQTVYQNTVLRPALEAAGYTGVNFSHVAPALLQPEGLVFAQPSNMLGSGGIDSAGHVRRQISAAPLPLNGWDQSAQAWIPPSSGRLAAIAQYGHTPSQPYNSADFPPRVGVTDVKRRSRFDGMDPHPLIWDPALDQNSSRQFRGRDEEGKVYRTFLHPPLPKPRTAKHSSANTPLTARSASATGILPASLSAGSGVAAAAVASVAGLAPVASAKRYHRPVKEPLPELNRATWRLYLANSQPLLSPNVSGRRPCAESRWRDELLKRKIDPHSQNEHK